MPIINQVVAGGGTTPTGTITITSNGTHDVTNYATADVNVPTTAPAHYIEKVVDANGVLQNGSSIIDLTGVSDVDGYVLQQAYFRNRSISGVVDMSGLTTVSGAHACESTFQASSVTGANLSALTTVSGTSACSTMFRDCFGLTSVNLSSLTTVSSQDGCSSMFYSCSGLTDISLPSLTTLTGRLACYYFCFKCSQLTTMTFPSLSTVSGQTACANMFASCTSLQSVWFYALNTTSFGTRTDQFSLMLQGVTGCSVHFPIRIQSTIGSWSDVTAGFGGTNTTVLFDIVTTLTGADGNTYTRQEKDSTSTATAWVHNDTLYYTSGVSDNDNGVNEPAVSDAIYSDAACTQSVTTVTAIA